MANSMAKNLVFVSAGKPNMPTKSVKQIVIWVETKKKKQKPHVVVFVGCKIGVDLLSEAITTKTGLKALAIHGDKPMKERRETLSMLLTGEVPVIAAMGVLGRGVDLLKVKQVIVFDMPSSIKEYIHQIGRAARLGEDGTAISFINEENKYIFSELVDVLKASKAVVPRELTNSRYAVKFTGKGQKKRKYDF